MACHSMAAAAYPDAGETSRLILLIGLAVLGYILKDTCAPLPAVPFSWDALGAGR